MTWRQIVDKIVGEHGRAAYISGTAIMFPSGNRGQSNGIGGLPQKAITYAEQELKPKPTTGRDWWDDPADDPAAEHRREMERELELQAQTEAELRAKAEREAAAAAADAKEQKRLADKAIADAGLAEFTLTGSDRPADVAAAAGQRSMFDEPAPAPEQDPHALEKEKLKRIKKISERQKMGLDTDHMRSDGLAATGWSAESAAQPAKAAGTIQLTDAEVFADDFARLEGKPLAQTVTVADTGQTATLKMDAAKAMRAQQARLDALKALRTCLGA